MGDSRVLIDDAEFIVRGVETKLDRDFIFATWMESARDARGELRKHLFEDWYPRYVEGLLASERVAILCREANRETVHTWACAGAENLLHWAYVPFRLRGLGIGRATITAALGDYPAVIHVTSSLPKQLRKSRRFFFNPFRIRGLA